ncbi:MAG: GNAT family N-acetyltransferase [Alphaproteobacteria bacterium]
MTDKKFSVRLAGPAASVGEKIWDALATPACAASQHPFTRHAFFAALEESGSATAETGWQPVHLLVESAGRPVGLLPLYLKSHSFGEYVFDHPWAEAFARAGGRYYPKLQASVPFTPVTGPRLLSGDATAKTLLLAAARSAVKELNASSLHITFLPQEEWRVAGESGFLLRQDQQFHWQNREYSSFDDFLANLSASRRKTIRKERAAVASEGVTFEWLTGRELTEAVWDDFFAGYVETGSRKWGRPYLTREFFSRVGESMGEQVLLVVAKRGGRTIAGALNFFGEGVLFGRNWGTTEFVDFLHFETCYYQAIEFAIANKLSRVEAGAQGPHKISRGYLPSPTYSAHYIAHAGLRRAVADYLTHERAAVADEMNELAAMAPFRKS